MIVTTFRTRPCPKCKSLNTTACLNHRKTVILRFCRACWYKWDDAIIETKNETKRKENQNETR